MKQWAIAAAALLTASIAQADTALDSCATIDADLDRLACYDKMSGRTPVTTTTPVPDSKGNWHTKIQTSKFDDTTDVFLNILSEAPVHCRKHSEPLKMTLTLRCLENTTSLILGTQNCHLTSGHGGYGRVDLRTDDDKARTINMVDSTDSRALGLWSGSKAIPAIKRLFDKNTLLVRFTPYGESPVTAEFDIAGIENAIKPLRKACSW